MTFPLDIQIGNFILPIHLITDILSFYVGYIYYSHLKKKEGDYVDFNKRKIIIIGAAIGALIGSRLLAALEHLDLFLNPPSFLYYYANKTIVGGIVGGILGVEVTKKILKHKQPTGDIFTFPLILAMIVGRIGCFLTGVEDGTVGDPSNLPWAFDQGDGISRHPTSLYEIIFLIFTFVYLKYLSKKIPLKTGILFRYFIILYLSFRFLVEFIKPVESIFLGLSSIQIVSLVVVLSYLYSLIFVFKHVPFLKKNI